MLFHNINILVNFKCEMEVIVDTNFIISCVRKNIDFLSQLEDQGFEVRVPREVMDELKDLRFRRGQEDRFAIDLALQMFEKKKVKKIKLGHRRVDEGLIAKGKQGIHIATLDREIRRNIPNAIIIYSAQKSVGVESKS